MQNIQNYIKPGQRAHLIGAGGVSMAPLAEVLHGKGVLVSGSDLHDSPTVDHLRSLGIPMTIGHLPESVEGAGCVIRTAAVHDTNPEVAAARNAGIPVFERAQAWGAIMSHYPNALCVAGTHGKTTATSMCTHIFLKAQRDPSVMVGGYLPILQAEHRVGQGDTIIAESCEYCNSFLSFCPTVAVILNVDADHLDFFKDLADVQNSFRRFAALVPETGAVVYNRDDENTCAALEGVSRPMLSFGLSEGDVHTKNLVYEGGMGRFELVFRGETLGKIALRVPGEHNVKNALAAAGASLFLQAPFAAVREGLESFTGAGRRFERKGTFRGAEVFDDYAHHPQELQALLTTTQSMDYKRVICAFQPHTYSRTKELFDQFAEVLKLPDQVVLAEIFPARETDTLGMSSQKLADHIPGAVCCATLEETAQKLAELAQPGDLILTVGAGDIVRAGELLLQMEA